MKLVIVDYGAGNLRSVARAVAHAGGEPLITSAGRDVKRAEGLIGPGAGAGAPSRAGRPGRVVRLPQGLKVPHMGWNQVRIVRPHPVFEGIPDESYFYFVHSYYPRPEDPAMVIGETEYGVTFASVVGRENVVATQLHPEKGGAR